MTDVRDSFVLQIVHVPVQILHSGARISRHTPALLLSPCQ